MSSTLTARPETRTSISSSSSSSWLSQRHATANPLMIYVVSRAIVFVAMYSAMATSGALSSLHDVVVAWDGIHYVDVAKNGYPHGLNYFGDRLGTSILAFLPAYPLLIRLFESVLPGDPALYAMFLSLVFGAAASVLLWRLAQHFVGDEKANKVTLLFCLFPGTFVFNLAYSESLAVTLALASTLAIVKGRVLTAGLLAALATATRPNMLALCVVFAWLTVEAFLRRRPVWRPLVATALSAMGFVSYNLWLWYRVDMINAWFRIEREGFGEGVRPGGSTTRAFGDILRDGFHRPFAPFGWLTALFVIIGIGLVVVTLRSSLPAWMKIYVVVIQALALTANVAPASLRLQLLAFPAFIPLAQYSRRKKWFAVGCGASVCLSVVLVLAYARGTVWPFYMWAP